MKNIPHKIYLQVGPDVESDEDFNKCAQSYEVTWSTSKIFDTDIVYYRHKNTRKNDKESS